MPAAANRKPRGTAAGRAPRPDGQATRQRLLEVACQMFAERGYADTTSKEICERAGTPLASVNYHFGSRDALYAAVLVEAHNRVASLDDIVRVTQGPGSPRQRLAVLLGFVVDLAARSNDPWALRLLLREIMSPSAAVPVLVDKAVRPKAALLLGLMGEVLGLPADHPSVQRAIAFTVLPCFFLLLAPPQIARRVLPALTTQHEDLKQELLRYMIGGLEAVAHSHRPPGAAPRRRPRA